MFWKKKKTPQISRQAQIIQVYLSGSTLFLPGREISPVAKAAAQVFILGMIDMLRQVQHLSWDEFIETYKTILTQHKILPSVSVEDFVNSLGELTSQYGDIEKVMRQGAQSIQMYIAEKDAQAPVDLISAVAYAEKNAANFSAITKIA